MPRALLLPICLSILASAAPAQAQVRRCVDARGVPVYTDRPCDAVQASPRDLPPDPTLGATIAGGFSVRGCARRPEQLLDGVRAALEAHDVNRLATWYHWPGTSSGAAKYLMDELEAIARRPLVSAELVYPALAILPADRAHESGAGVEFPDDSPVAGMSGNSTPTPDLLPSPAQARESAPALAGNGGNGVRFTSPVSAASGERVGEVNPTPFSPPATAAELETPPEGLQVQQMQGPADIAAVSTRFRLQRNAGCWWIEL